MGPDQTASASTRVAEHVSQAREFVDAQTVAFYAATRDEVSTRAIFDAALASGKCCVFPRCISGGRLEFAVISNWGDLEPGSFGILEPLKGATLVELARIDLMLVPGLAFDGRGGRLGRGGGYYDRTFSTVKELQPVLMGVAHSVQVFDAVPMGDHDRRMHLLALETGIVRIDRPGPIGN